MQYAVGAIEMVENTNNSFCYCLLFLVSLPLRFPAYCYSWRARPLAFASKISICFIEIILAKGIFGKDS